MFLFSAPLSKLGTVKMLQLILKPRTVIMFFPLPAMLRKVNLELTVLDYDRIGGSDAIGGGPLATNRAGNRIG